jgi:hypothetical protein
MEGDRLFPFHVHLRPDRIRMDILKRVDRQTDGIQVRGTMSGAERRACPIGAFPRWNMREEGIPDQNKSRVSVHTTYRPRRWVHRLDGMSEVFTGRGQTSSPIMTHVSWRDISR